MEVKIDTLKTVKQFGFVERGESGNQVYGECPFCSEPKFYINNEKMLWDCKKCQRQGGFYTFINDITGHCANLLSPSGRGADLAKARGVSEKTLRLKKVGYNPLNDTFLIPTLFFDNTDKVLNISIYNGTRVLNTSGCKLGLFGWEGLYNKHEVKTVWLCEGVWDWLVMSEVLKSLGKKNDVAIGVPGAGTFKVEWGQFFEKKQVNVLYDNDEAGRMGMVKIHNSLIHYAEGLKFVHWGQRPDGFDVNDLYRENKSSAMKMINSLRALLQSAPAPALSKTGKLVTPENREKVVFTGKGIDCERVYKVYRKWLHLPSVDGVDILFGTILGNRLDGDPIWMFLEAPSGGTKTELLMSVSTSKAIEAISSLTPRTLVSGMTLEGGVDPSLLPKLDGKILIIKDFTSILSMNKINRDEILGDLRDAYDGEYSKPFGNAKWRKYTSRFGIIAGVTPVIEQFLTNSIVMGERFLRFPLPLDNSIKGRKDLIRRAMGNVANETEMREALRDVAGTVLDHDYKTIPEIPDNINEKIVSLSHWICMIRGVVSRDTYTRQVTNSPHIEVGSRVAKQLCKEALGIAMFKGKKKIDHEEYKLLLTLARGSVFKDYEKLFRFIFSGEKDFSSAEIGEGLRLPTQLVDRIANDLYLTGVLSKQKISAFGFKWSVTKEVVALVQDCEIYQ